MIKYGQAQQDRLALIELRLRFFGEVRRGDLMSRFGIEKAAATRDLALYRSLKPGNLDYDTKGKIYLRGKDFVPVFDLSPERVLTWLALGYGDKADSTLRPLLPVDLSVRPAAANVELETLSVITRAIHLGKAMEISYDSLAHGKTDTELVPFALGDAGLRWVVRGFDRNRREFRDFAITRIGRARLLDGVVRDEEMQDRDIQWHRVVEMEIVPHPSNVLHPNAIETEYSMTRGVLKLNVRAAFVGYLLRLWSVDCSPDHKMRGVTYLLWLRNREALYGVANLGLVPGYV